MANVANAFSALLGAGEAAASSSKKKNKSKAKQNAAGPSSDVNITATSSAASAHATPQHASVVDASEATAILERAAREARTITDKSKLWKEWARQGSDRSGKGIKYRASDGAALDFKQVMLLSKALEISIESSLVTGLAHEHHESLVALLTVFFHSSGNVPQVLVSQLVRLAGLLSNEAPDTLGAAQRAVHGVVSALKSAVSDQGHGETDAAAGWLSRINTVDKDIAKQQGLTQKLAATNGGVVTKEQLSSAKTVYKLSEEKFDLLQPGNLPAFKPSSGAAETTSKALAELRSVVDNHLKEASALEDSAKGKAGSAESQRVQTLAAYRREESIVAQEAVAVAAQIRTLEAQLRALRARQAELDDRRAALLQQSRLVGDGSGGPSRGAAGGVLSAAHYRDEIAVIHALNELVHPSQHSSPEHVVSVQQSQAHAPRDYISSGQAYLQLAASSLLELPNRLTFCKQRMSQAVKLAKLVGTGAGAGGAGGKKEEAEKLLSDYMRGAEELFRGCMAVVSDMNQRYDAISRSAGGADAAEGLRVVDALNRQVHEAYDSVQASYRAPLIEAPPPAPRQHHQSGNRGGAAAAALTNGAASAGHAALPTSKASAAAATSSSRPVSAAPSAVLVAAFPAAAAAHAASQLLEPVAAPIVAPVVAPRPAGPPPKQWGRVQAAAPAEATPEGDDAPAPTPAEAAAARAAEAAVTGGVDGGFKEVAAKKNKRREA